MTDKGNISMYMGQYKNEYKQELFAQRTPYLQWLKAQEKELEKRYGGKKGSQGRLIRTLPFSSCMESVQGYGELQEDITYLFVRDGGRMSDYAAAVFAEVFGGGGAVLSYADEDYRGSLWELYEIADGAFGGEITEPYAVNGCADCRTGDLRTAYFRGEPWFKPDFSPDTLASFFYIGSIFAIRGEQILKVTAECGSGVSIYELVYRIFMDSPEGKGIVHVPAVLYTNDSLADAGRLDSSGRIKVLYQEQGNAAQNDKISIVIPSKDNANVLKKCLETLIQYTNYGCYEIIVVDNGSSPEQQNRIARQMDVFRQMKEGGGIAIRYFYQEMAFNFSAMCNIGARMADGAYLLFLNDDIEVMDTEEGRLWLDRMLLYARKAHVGAVGAKLYYPCEKEANGCYKIQHAGITNMGIGPAHKLGGMVDTGCLYHGHNTQNYDMLAVTAACMLIRKSVFDEAGGFDETFPVAYNDVELCFRLYESGYFNVQVNEAVLIHHESLSRGQDLSPEKQMRLAAEKERLYQKHMLLRAKDPFYSPNLVQWRKDAEYNTGYLYAYDRQNMPVLLQDSGEAGKRKRAVFKGYDIRSLLQRKNRTAAKIYDRLTGYHNILFQIDSITDNNINNAGCDSDVAGDIITGNLITDDGLTIEGWCAVKNKDNADMPRKMWLICMTRNFDFRNVYEFDIAPKRREDVAALLEQAGEKDTGTKNTALSGIQVNIRKSDLKPGTYRIGLLCGNKLVCDLEKNVKIPAGDAGYTKKETDTEDQHRKA